jgi:hypothetical protein
LRAGLGAIARASGVERAFDQSVAAYHHAAAAERSQLYFFFFSWLEAYGCARGNIQAHPVGGCAIEFKFAIGFEKMEVASYLDRAVASVAHDYARCRAPGVCFDGSGGFIQNIFARFHARAPGCSIDQ